MMTLDEMAKVQLEAKLDEHFPKGNANRGSGLMIMAEAYIIIRATIKSFGRCMKCFGKGYGTQTLYARGRGESDMETGDVVVDEKLPTVVFCSCDRGEQLKQLWTTER